MKKRVGIIGGGAAGLFTACQFSRLSDRRDIEVTVIEKNAEAGKKLTLTGHGRCNITNRKMPSELKNGFHEAKNFIYPALNSYGPEDTIAFFEKEVGLKLKEEENNRMFPVCDSAVKLRDEVVRYVSSRVNLICNTKVLDIKKTDTFEVSTTAGNYSFDYLVLSCGGSSFPKTGSTGDSYIFAGLFGHTVVPVRSALAPVKADDKSVLFTRNLSGVSLNAKLSLYCEGKKISSITGEMLFADFGLTGPAVMEISRDIPVQINGTEIYLELDLVPSISDEQLDAELQELIKEHPDTKVSNLLSKYVPSSVATEVTALAGDKSLYAQSLPKEIRKKIVRELKHRQIGISEVPSLEKAYVTRGGVSLKEIDRTSYQSKLVPGLYIIGEALDIDGTSGGWNLQACMSEAFAVAKDISNK